MPVDEWPEADRDAWHLANRRGDLLDGNGLAADWRETTRLTTCKAYGRWLTFLDRNDWLKEEWPPNSRVTRERLRAYLDHLELSLAPVTIYGRIRDLSQAIRVMNPEGDRQLLMLATNRLKSRAMPTRDKRVNLVSTAELAGLGLKLMAMSERDQNRRRIWQSSLYRDGLTILLLACRPLRRSAVVRMRLNRHLVRSGESWRISFGPEETKNHRSYETSLDPRLTPFIDRYLEKHRPVLLGIDNPDDHVWISWRARPMTDCCLYYRIVSLTQKHLGRRVTPHLFRDAAITTLANEAPEKVWLGMALLHHADHRTAEKHYNQALDATAVENYQKRVVALRKRVSSRRTTPADRRR